MCHCGGNHRNIDSGELNHAINYPVALVVRHLIELQVIWWRLLAPINSGFSSGCLECETMYYKGAISRAEGAVSMPAASERSESVSGASL